MNPSTEAVALLDDLMRAVEALHAWEPNGHLRLINATKTIGQWYDAVHALWWAASSKELRDGASDEVHLLCEDIRERMRRIEPFFSVKLYPASPPQRRSWECAAAKMRHWYKLREGDPVEVILFDSRLLGTTLHVRRELRQDGEKAGVWPDFKIRVDEAQAEHLRTLFARSRAMQAAVRERQKALAREAKPNETG